MEHLLGFVPRVRRVVVADETPLPPIVLTLACNET